MRPVPDFLFNPENGHEGALMSSKVKRVLHTHTKKLERSRTAREFPLVFTFVGFIIVASIGVVAIFVAFLALKVA
jgi:hypothetical protein